MINRGCVGRNGVVSNVLASRDRLQNALDEDQKLGQNSFIPVSVSSNSIPGVRARASVDLHS